MLSLSLMREDIKYRPNSRLTLLRSVARWWTGSGVWMMIIRGIWRQMLRQISEISLHGALDEHTRELSLLWSCKHLMYRHSSHFFLWRHQHLLYLSLGLIFSGVRVWIITWDDDMLRWDTNTDIWTWDTDWQVKLTNQSTVFSLVTIDWPIRDQYSSTWFYTDQWSLVTKLQADQSWHCHYTVEYRVLSSSLCSTGCSSQLQSTAITAVDTNDN